MRNIHKLWSDYRIQYTAYFIVSSIVLVMTAGVGYSSTAPFERFIGKIDPLLTIAGAVLVGYLFFSLLLQKGWGKIYQAGKGGIKWPLIGLTIFLALNSVWIDSVLVFPEDINILWPASLLFYPSIAFFVEILFHIIPFTLLVGLASLFLPEEVFPKSIGVVLFLVALLEPTFQIFFMEEMPLWGKIAVGVNLFLFNILQLYTFKRYDFIRMFALRLVFYLIWHIVWGVLRLELLF